MCADIACVAAPRICPPGARAKVDLLFCDKPLEGMRFRNTCRKSVALTRNWIIAATRNHSPTVMAPVAVVTAEVEAFL
jgi:hypothetical protein